MYFGKGDLVDPKVLHDGPNDMSPGYVQYILNNDCDSDI